MAIKKPLVLILAVIIISLVAACSNSKTANEEGKQTIEYRLSHPGTEGNEEDFYSRYSNKFADLVHEHTDGELEIKIYGQGELYDNYGDMTKAVMGGSLEIAVTSVPGSYPEAGVPEASIVSAPRLFQTAEQFYQFIEDENGYQIIKELLEKKGAKELDTFLIGQQYFYSPNEIKNVEDFKGMIIRAGGEGTRNFIEAVGASVSTLSIPEVYGGLQQGVIDGLATGLDAYARNNFYEVAPNIMAENWLFTMYNMSLIIGNESWGSLPDHLQAAIEEKVIPELHEWAISEIEKQWEKDREKVNEKANWIIFSNDVIKELDQIIVEEVYPHYHEISPEAEQILKAAQEAAGL